MKLLKKISVAALLLSLLLALAVPVQADAKTEITECGLHFNKETCYLYDDNGISVKLSEKSISQVANGNVAVVAHTVDAETIVVSVLVYAADYKIGMEADMENIWFCDSALNSCSGANGDLYVYYCQYSYELSSDGERIFTLLEDNSAFSSSITSNDYLYKYKTNYYLQLKGEATELIYNDDDVFGVMKGEDGLYDLDTSVVVWNREDYTLAEFCVDAGLNNSASTNESESVIPYWYEPSAYSYVVRKNINGQYLLTMIQKGTDGLQNYPVYYNFETGGRSIGLGSVCGFEHTSTIRNFVYDVSGNGWILQEKIDATFTDEYRDVGCYLDSTKVLVYTDSVIYSSSDGSVVEEEKTEDFNDVIVEISPTPSGGSGRPGAGTRPEMGGQATGGGGLDFIINLWTLIWTKICSVPMNVDGYSISLQQIFVYDILVGVVGGFILSFIFRRR